MSGTSERDLPDALKAFDAIEARLADRRPFLCLDYDGTLTPIVAQPELAVIDLDARATLGEVGRVCPTAIVSGRALEDVRRLVGVPWLYYAGNHGFEIEGHGLSLDVGREYEALMAEVRDALAPRLADMPGILLEDKGCTLSVHYRHASERVLPAFYSAVDTLLIERPRLAGRMGKKVLEIRPAVDWHKGRAVRWLHERIDRDAVPIFIGDDLTDEDAFEVIADDGIGVLVSETPRMTKAHFRIPDVDAVYRLLARIGAHAVRAAA
ncbi:MAG TPA: trehalose-phosphatase [Burkholderiales bacterium]|nr:trehalose-phosphatase [Burkholderiales bacterium]